MSETRNPYDKVIFLDIEGVIVTHCSIIVNHCPEKQQTYHGGRAFWWHFIDKNAMGLVYMLAREYGAKIVLTSTLRGMSHTLVGLEAVAPIWAADDPYEYLSTEHTKFLNSREREIAEFVARNKVRKYVVFDDNPLACPNFILTNAWNGLSYEEYQEAKVCLADTGQEVNQELVFI